MGNSSEKVSLKDLNDVIYYKQIKEYTDLEYEKSKDLKKDIAKGRLIILENSQSARASLNNIQSNNNLSLLDIKAAVREALPHQQGVTEEGMKNAIREIATLVVNVVRQELSGMTANTIINNNKPEIQTSSIPLYIPEISSTGMKSNIEAKKISVSGNEAEDALLALRKLKRGN